MRRFIIFSIISMVFSWAALGQNESIKVGNTTRNFLVHVPSSGLPDNPALVIDMHGVFSTPAEQQSRSGFDKVADREKFIAVFPEGINKAWETSGNRDVDFMSTLIDTFVERYNVDRKRVYACGFSNGAMMSYKLACTATDKFAAIGVMSGYLTSGSPSGPISVCHVHGASDDLFSSSGVAGWLSTFVKANGCPESATTTELPTSTKQYWGSCEDGNEIVYYAIKGWSHAYPNASNGNFSPADTFWAFFSKHPEVGATGVTNRVLRIRTPEMISVEFSAGRIHLLSAQRDQSIRSVRVFDVKGTSIFTWKAVNGPVRSLSFPFNRRAGGLYLFNVAVPAGNVISRVLVP